MTSQAPRSHARRAFVRATSALLTAATFTFGGSLACGTPTLPTTPRPEAMCDARHPDCVAQVDVHNVHHDYCLGVLVRPSLVLTAAHCAAYNESGRGGTGTWTVRLGARAYRADRAVLIHEGWRRTPRERFWEGKDMRDLALLVLTTPALSVLRPRLDVDRVSYLRGHVARAQMFTNQARGVSRAWVASDAPARVGGAIPLLRAEGHELVTPRVTSGGDSGGPLFDETSGTLLALEARYDESGLDVWTAVDQEVSRWIDAVERDIR